MLEANENIQLATLTDQDLRIDVYMGDIGTADFPRVPDTIPLGEQAARKVVDKLARFSVTPAEYVAWRERVTMHQAIDVRVAQIRFEGLDKVNPEYLRSRTRIRPGDDVTIETISSDAMRMAVLDDVDSVAYRLEGDAANPTLVWMPNESSVGHDVLRPSMGIYAAGAGDYKFLLGIQYVRHWLNDRGGQWRNNVQVGYETMFRTSLYQPFDVAQRYFVEPTLFASRSVEDLYVDGEPSRFTASSTLEVVSNSASMRETTPSCGSAMCRATESRKYKRELRIYRASTSVYLSSICGMRVSWRARRTTRGVKRASRGMAFPPRCNTRKSTSRLVRIATGAASRPGSARPCRSGTMRSG